MKKILQTGSIYFFYRPKIENQQEAQRFFLILHPDKSNKYYLLIIGKKHLPEAGKDNGYFLFVDKTTENKEELLQSLSKKHHHTKTRGERNLPTSQCLDEGKYLLAEHENHTHFIYQLTNPTAIKEIQQEFNLRKEDDYLISVKNPKVSSSAGIGLNPNQKASYSSELQQQFANYRFISLNPPDFLDYEGAELLLIPKVNTNLAKRDKELKTCLEKVNKAELAQEFKKISFPESLVLIEK